jgi:adenylate cyclase
MTATRRLAAILAADVAGYSRLMGADEEGTHERLKTLIRQLVDPKVREHRGRIVKNTGDGMLVEFGSIVDAVRCAAEIQQAMKDCNTDIPEDKRISFRMGINLGDVIVEPDDIFGDGVNIAARLEELSEPGGICISRTVYDHIGDRLPYSFEDVGEQWVKNIARPLHVYRTRLNAEAEATVTQAAHAVPSPLPLPDKPSIAVLPFQNIGGDPEQEYFADGMVEEIITALSRIKWLFVIARNSSFTYKGQNVDVKQVGQELGVRYILEGSVRKAGHRVRITGQLIDTVSGTHLWADRFDGSLDDIFELQDMVAASVAGIIEPALQAAEIRRSTEKPTNDLSAYDLYLRALTHTYAWEREGILARLDLLRRAIERDPHYGSALALAAVYHQNLHLNGWSENPEIDRRKAVDFARKALQAANDDPGVLGNVAVVLGYFGEDIGAAIGMINRSLALNPSFARGWLLSGWLRVYAGQPDLAVEHFETSLRLNPRVRKASQLRGIGQAHFFSRRFDDAVSTFLIAQQEVPTHVMPYRFLAACYAHMGRLDDAREMVQRLRDISPVVVPDAMHWRNPEHRELFLSGLRLAAGETI